MAEQMKNPITIVEVIPLTVHDGDSDTDLASDEVDMQQAGGYENALVIAQLGAVGADVTALTLKIEEDDDSAFGSATDAEGGAAVDVSAGDATFTFQVKRTKRYIRALLEVTEDGAADDVEIAVSAILNNWAKPFNVR